MSYLNTYKKRMSKKGANIREHRENIGKDVVNVNFELTQGYKKGLLNRVGSIDKEDVDIIVKSTSGELQKYFLFRPNYDIGVGSYVTYDNDQTYIIREYNKDVITPTARAYFCNQYVNFKGNNTAVPCWVSNSTYGSKGIADMERFLLLDAKLKVYIQRNEYTDTLKIGQRIMFANRYVYKITEMDNLVYGDGLYVIVTQRDELMPMDDLENNLAWNEYEDYEENEKPISSIVGQDKIVLGDTHEYTIESNATWETDEPNMIDIVEQGENSIKIKGVKRGWITLYAKNNEEIIADKDIMIC